MVIYTIENLVETCSTPALKLHEPEAAEEME